MAGRYFKVSTFVATAIEIGRIVGGLFSRDQRAAKRPSGARRKTRPFSTDSKPRTQVESRGGSTRCGRTINSGARREEEPSSPEMK